MPSRAVIDLFAMYVIGEVESNWNWAAVNYNDPITLGMMQNYGTRAAGFLNLIKDANGADWAYLVANAPTLTNDVNAHAASNTFWNRRYLTRTEGNALIHVMGSDANHLIQQNLFMSDADDYIDNVLLGWGMSESHPRELIFAMCMYHQSPRRAGEVIRSAGGTANLDRLYTTCLNNSVLGNYRTRYTKAYNRLKAWDGASNPPDFGQITTTESAEDGRGDLPSVEQRASRLGYIIQQGDVLMMYGPAGSDYEAGVVFYPAGGQRYTAGYKPDTDTITGGDTSPGSSTDGQELVNYMLSLVGDFTYVYGHPGRLNPVVSGKTDCSGLCWYVYKHVAGIDVGTYTGAMIKKGTRVFYGAPGDLNEANMQLGDLVLYYWNDGDLSVVDHVEMYIGQGRVCGINAGTGPTIKNSIGRGAYRIDVRRYL